MAVPTSSPGWDEDSETAWSGRPAWLLAQSRSALRRYLLLSSGISSVALGLALIISFLAATYGADAAAGQFVLAEGSSFQVVTSNERSTSAFLDRVGAPPVAAEPSPEVTVFAAASREVPFGVQPASAAEVTPEASPEPTAVPATPTAVPQIAAAASVQVTSLGRIDNVNLTFYDCKEQGFCGRMSSGRTVYEGAAACSWNLPTGARFVIINDPTERIYVCEDRGLLTDTWIDVFFHDPAEGWAWQRVVGRRGSIEILSLP